MLGVKIESGPDNWQIIQQTNGEAELRLSGSYRVNESAQSFRVMARVLREADSEPVTAWEPADIAAGEGKWRIAMTVPVGGPYRVETCLNEDDGPIEWSRRGDIVHHIGVGDVFVIAGQSNSVGYGREAILDAPQLGVHILRNNGRWDLATHPLGDNTGTAHSINADAANVAHSPYLHFGKHLMRELGYPIGLLQTALGGSPLERWNPKEKGDLYVNMVDIIKETGYGIRGVLWYQGCSDTNTQQEAESYFRRFFEMVNSLRAELRQPELVFLLNPSASITCRHWPLPQSGGCCCRWLEAHGSW